MKNLFSFIAMLFLTHSSFSQVYKINIRNIQSFEHPIMSTNDAINQNKIVYIDAGTTNSNFMFDLERMRLYRNAEGVLGEFEIVEKYNDNTIFNVMVKFSNGQYANFIYQIESTGFYTLYCKWIENDKINGWFDRTISKYSFSVQAY
jgi:hypothetical protein